MNSIESLVQIIQNHEAILSGIAAVLAITGIMSTWCFRLVQQAGLTEHVPLASFSERIKALPLAEPKQEIRYCRAPDKSAIAYATSGASKGKPIVRSLGWFTHLEAEWAYTQGRALWAEIGRTHPLVRYDGRGIGLSARASKPTEQSPLEDLEAVMDAAGIEQAVLFGLSEGGLTAIQYAAKHPERVSHLVLYGSYLAVQDFTDVAKERWLCLMPLFKNAWGASDPAARQLFTSLFLPDGDRAQNHYFNEMQRASADSTTATRYIQTSIRRDVSQLATQLDVPTLVFHREGDLCVPLQAGRKIAASIPGARFELLPGNNHWMLAKENDSDRVIRMINEFIGD